jgi:Protein of unknown function (DUF1761)
MEMNFLAIGLAALVNVGLGFVWYNPKTFGQAWMKESGLSPESIKGMNMPMIFGSIIVFAFMLAMAMNMLVLHQMHVYSLAANALSSAQEGVKTEANMDITRFLGKYGAEFKTFKHGALHGFLSSLFIVLPVIATNALFEKKTWKYIFINVGYWALSFTLMGGIISAMQP